MTRKKITQLVHISIQALLFIVFTGQSYSHGTNDKQLISPAQLASEKGIYKIIDLRSENHFIKAHIPSSFSLPLQHVSQQKLKDASILPEDTIVLYASSESAAKKGKPLFEVLGYSKVKVLAGGFTHWVEDKQEVETGQSNQKLLSKNVGISPELQVIPESYDFGKISKTAGIIQTVFKLSNDTETDIQIDEITTSCGCTTAKLENMIIASNSSQNLTVLFDPNFHKEPQGRFSRTVFLQHFTGSEQQIKIFVEIVE